VGWRVVRKLSAAKIRGLTKPGRYGDGDGLWLQVRDAERRAWLFRYRLNGRAHAMGLGSLRDVGLAEARQLATECRAALRRGLDPLESRRAAQADARLAGARLFRDVCDLYLAAHGAAWRNERHRAQWISTLTAHVFPIFGDRPVAAVDTGDVMAALEPLWPKRPETASRLRGRIESVLDFAKARGWRTGENPARWRGHLKNLLPSRAKLSRVEHLAALAYGEVGALMAELRGQPGIAALVLRFTILTAARAGEAVGARWSEIDGPLWIIPADRMKAGREHRVPLSDAAATILDELAAAGTEPGAFIFPGRRARSGLGGAAMIALLRRMKRTEITVHGFRSTFRDWAAEQTAYPREVAEAALAHALSDKVEAAYRRSDFLERRARLMADWATFCERPSTDGADVVPIRKRLGAPTL
jgi:integrase